MAVSPSPTQSRRVAALARFGPGPFTTAQARAAGLTRDDLRSHAVTTVMRGVHLDAGARVDHQVRCAAALLVSHPDAWVAGGSAARLLGLPVPDHDLIQVSVPPRVEMRRPDLAFPQERVAVECGGAHHFASEDQKHLDAVRREEAQAAGWIIVTVAPRGIFTDPAGTLTQVVRALQTRGRHVVLDEDWRHHFPQRTR